MHALRIALNTIFIENFENLGVFDDHIKVFVADSIKYFDKNGDIKYGMQQTDLHTTIPETQILRFYTRIVDFTQAVQALVDNVYKKWPITPKLDEVMKHHITKYSDIIVRNNENWYYGEKVKALSEQRNIGTLKIELSKQNLTDQLLQKAKNSTGDVDRLLEKYLVLRKDVETIVSVMKGYDRMGEYDMSVELFEKVRKESHTFLSSSNVKDELKSLVEKELKNEKADNPKGRVEKCVNKLRHQIQGQCGEKEKDACLKDPQCQYEVYSCIDKDGDWNRFVEELEESKIAEVDSYGNIKKYLEGLVIFETSTGSGIHARTGPKNNSKPLGHGGYTFQEGTCDTDIISAVFKNVYPVDVIDIRDLVTRTILDTSVTPEQFWNKLSTLDPTYGERISRRQLLVLQKFNEEGFQQKLKGLFVSQNKQNALSKYTTFLHWLNQAKNNNRTWVNNVYNEITTAPTVSMIVEGL